MRLPAPPVALPGPLYPDACDPPLSLSRLPPYDHALISSPGYNYHRCRLPLLLDFAYGWRHCGLHTAYDEYPYWVDRVYCTISGRVSCWWFVVATRYGRPTLCAYLACTAHCTPTFPFPLCPGQPATEHP